MQNCRPRDMSNALFHHDDHLRGADIRCNYGAGAIVNADERLKEELATGRVGRGQIRVQRPIFEPLSEAQEELEKNNEAITKARLRREALEKELKEARIDEKLLDQQRDKIANRIKIIREKKNGTEAMQEKRQAAFARKWEGKGAKPRGVIKTKPAPPIKIINGRLAKLLGP
jgi:septal ring factor EnvC (AmiA/AmiB activator)